MVDVISWTTGEVLKTFEDKIWFADGKRVIRMWIKKNGYTEVEYKNGSVYVATIEELTEVQEKETSEMGGTVIKNFYICSDEYQVREYDDSTFGKIYKIWKVSQHWDEDSELIYTIYRKSRVQVFIDNMMDDNMDAIVGW